MWPDRIVSVFAKVPSATSDESEYYGPYNKLLAHLFPLDGDRDYTICARVGLPPSKDGSHMGVTFEVVLDGKPVFILDIKPSGYLHRRVLRASADDQVRSRLGYHEGPTFSLRFLIRLSALCRGLPTPPPPRRQCSRYKAMLLHVLSYTANVNSKDCAPTTHPLRSPGCL
jgi:hypothetical protein